MGRVPHSGADSEALARGEGDSEYRRAVAGVWGSWGGASQPHPHQLKGIEGAVSSIGEVRGESPAAVDFGLVWSPKIVSRNKLCKPSGESPPSPPWIRHCPHSSGLMPMTMTERFSTIEDKQVVKEVWRKAGEKSLMRHRPGGSVSCVQNDPFCSEDRNRLSNAIKGGGQLN